MSNQDALDRLVGEWERRARRAFFDAEHEPDPMGRRLIEHGAMCYFNCIQELTAALTLASPVAKCTPNG